jgi:hypothetical protein
MEGGREGEKEGERKCMGKDERKTVDTHTGTTQSGGVPLLKNSANKRK